MPVDKSLKSVTHGQCNARPMVTGWPHFGRGGNLRTFQLPIPVISYHVRKCLWHHIKTNNSLNVVVLNVVTWQTLLL